MKYLFKRLNITFTTCLLSLWTIVAQAQEDFDDVLDLTTRHGGEQDANGNPIDFEDRIGLRFSDFTDEFVAIFTLLVAIAITRHFVNKRDRKGCTFFIIIFAAVVYIIYKFL